jgi:hypothetical protein
MTHNNFATLRSRSLSTLVISGMPKPANTALDWVYRETALPSASASA